MLLRLAEDADDAEQPHLRQAHEKFLMAIAHSVKSTRVVPCLSGLRRVCVRR
jgi:hypothetical protein